MEPFAITTAWEKINNLQKRIRIVQGGTSSSKTFSIIATLYDYAVKNPDKRIDVLTDTLPNVKIGALQDFKKILRMRGIWHDTWFGVSDSTYYLPNGSNIRFSGTDDSRGLGARRDVLFLNEANRLSEDTFNQVEIRTKDFIFIDFNPVRKFWAHDLLDRDDVDFLKLTYLDNEAIPDEIKTAIEKRKENSNWWRVFALGEIGEVEGLVYSGWLPVDNLPENTELLGYGLDFGFSQDESACIAVYRDEEDRLYLDEKFYKIRMLPSDYVPELERHKIDYTKPIVCDSARPELIAEINRGGYLAVPCDKGAGSVASGILTVQDRKIMYTRNSKNIEAEYLTYSWKKRRSGEITDAPEDAFDHAMDAVRYAITYFETPAIEYAGVK